jgi:hypothetical protein
VTPVRVLSLSVLLAANAASAQIADRAPHNVETRILENEDFAVYTARFLGAGNWCYSTASPTFDETIVVVYKKPDRVIALDERYRREMQDTIMPAVRKMGCPPRGSRLGKIQVDHYFQGVRLDRSGGVHGESESVALEVPVSSLVMTMHDKALVYGALTSVVSPRPLASRADVAALSEQRVVGPGAPSRGSLAESVGPVHNAYQLLQETPLVRVHAGRPEILDRWCASGSANVSLVFKVDDRYEVVDTPAYWQIVDRDLVPAVKQRCPGVRRIDIENYITGYRLDGLERVWPVADPFPSDTIEQPISRAQLDLEAPAGILPRSLGNPSSGRSPDSTNASIAALRTAALKRAEAQRAAAAGAAAARADFERWSYTHEKGFEVSAGELAREEEARDVVRRASLNTLGALAETLQVVSGAMPEGPHPMTLIEAAGIVDAATRRAQAQAIVQTLATWTRRDLVPAPELAGYANGALIRDAIDGRFEPWVGSQPATLGGVLPTHLLDTTVAAMAYQLAFSERCALEVPGPWIRYTYSLDLVTRSGSGFETNRDTGEKHVVQLREPFVEPLARRLKAMLERSSASVVAQQLLFRPTVTQESATADFTRFLQRFGCGSPTTRQLEVNLHLMADGLPAVQQVLPDR